MSNQSAPARAPMPGYLEDAQGRLVPERLVKPADLERDALVRELIARVEATAESLAHTKAALLGDVAAHIALVGERYGVSISGEGGNVALTSYDGRLKVERSVADRIAVGEEIHAAQELIRQILDEIGDPVARAIADRAFRRNRKTGELSASRLIDLVSVEIDDPRWRAAVAAIRDAMRAEGSATYFRAYRRAEADQPWEQIPLDFSAVVPRPAATPAFAGAGSGRDAAHTGEAAA